MKNNVKFIVCIILCLSIICLGFTSVPTKARINTSELVIDPKINLSTNTSTMLYSKSKLGYNVAHVLEIIPEVVPVAPVYVMTTENYFNMFPEAVRNAFYADGWTWEKVDYNLGPVYGFDSILGLTVWGNKQILIDYKDSANSSILHEIGHAFEYSPRVKGVNSTEFLNLYNAHWQEWHNNYGMHINNYNTPEEGYAQCWEIFILKPWCLDDETRAFIESEIYNIGE